MDANVTICCIPLLNLHIYFEQVVLADIEE
jgi:hypothetical protein